MNSESAPTTTATTEPEPAPAQLLGGVWSPDEHNRFLEAMQLYPQGPWKDIADHVATRSVRQVQTHAQKYHEKVARRMRGLRKERKKLLRPEHRIDDEMLSLCRELESERIQPSVSSSSPFSSASSASGLSRPADARPQQLELRSQQHSIHVSASAPHRLPNDEVRSEHLERQHRHSEPHIAIFSSSDSAHRYSDPRLSDHYYHHHVDSHGQHQPLHHLHYHKYDGRHQDGSPKDEFAPALVELATAMPTHRPRHEMPSFHDCLDFLIDVFGSRECSDASLYRQHYRR